MQKKVLAAALGGLLMAPAAYAADVNISGKLSAGLENYDVEPLAGSSESELLVTDQSSRIIFNISEELGGGLSAWAQIDNRFRVDTGAFAASGNTQVGLQGDWGKLAIGRSDLHYNELFAYDGTASGSLQTLVTGSVFSQVDGNTIANNTRTPNAIVWDGVFGGGITARVAYSTSPFAEEADNPPVDEGDAVTAALRWRGGPLAVGASFWSAEDEAGTTEQDSTRAWVAYTFGNITTAFGWDVSSITTAGVEQERDAFALPIRLAMGADTFAVKFAVADEIDGAPDSGASIWSVGWDRALSKRTHVGVHYTALDNDDAASYNFFANGLSGLPPGDLGAGSDASQLYFGIVHLY